LRPGLSGKTLVIDHEPVLSDDLDREGGHGGTDQVGDAGRVLERDRRRAGPHDEERPLLVADDDIAAGKEGVDAPGAVEAGAVTVRPGVEESGRYGVGRIGRVEDTQAAAVVGFVDEAVVVVHVVVPGGDAR